MVVVKQFLAHSGVTSS